MVKDYLEEEGLAEDWTPRKTYKKAIEAGLLKDGHLWIALVNDRNQATHTYKEDLAIALRQRILDHYIALYRYQIDVFSQRIDQ